MRALYGMKLGAVALGASLALAACGTSSGGGSASSAPGSVANSVSGGSSSPAMKTLKVGMAYDVGGRGDKSFNDLAAAGLDKAKTDLNIETKELSAVQRRDRRAEG